MDYAQISKNSVTLIYQARESLKNSSLGLELLALAELKVSQINGCQYCCQIHTTELKKLGVSDQKIEALSNWQNQKELFSEKECVVLFWSEQVTQIDKDELAKKDSLFAVFSEKEVVDLTLCISLMNALNRITIALKG